jgi:hypothetical protein
MTLKSADTDGSNREAPGRRARRELLAWILLLDEPGVGPVDVVLHIPVPAEQDAERQPPRPRNADTNRQGFIAAL